MARPVAIATMAGITILLAVSALWAAGSASGEVRQAYIPVSLADEGELATATPTLDNPVTSTPQSTEVSTEAPTETPTGTSTATPTETPTATPTETPTATPTETPTATPTATQTPTPTVSPTPTKVPLPGGPEIVAYDWNTPVLQSHNGFPRDTPPKENGDWTYPYDYAQGTLYIRAEIRDIPVEQQGMQISFCFWQQLVWGQPTPEPPVNHLETCTTETVDGIDGNIVTWSKPIKQMWKLGGHPLDWARARWRAGIGIKNSAGIPVSTLVEGWNWGCGTDPNCIPAPANWYPMDIRFTVVVVPNGGTFSGWDNYIP